MSTITGRVKAVLSSAANFLSGKPNAKEEKPVEVQQEEPVKPVRKSRKKILSKVTPARRIGSNSKLSLPEQEKIQQAAIAKRERRMKRSNGWSAS